jgi:PEP-CTERM motif
MKRFTSQAVFAFSMLFAVGVASAAPLPMCSSGTSDVTANNFSCTLDGLTFSNFTVSITGDLDPTQVGLSSNTTAVSGDEVNLGFQFNDNFSNSPADTGDLMITYEVTGAITGVDNNIQGVGTGTITVLETVCSVALVDSDCPTSPTNDVLGTLTNTSTNGSDATSSTTFSAASPVFIKKDISFNGAATSEFTNSQLVGQVPEPMTLSLMGAGLLGLGFFGRRRRQK